MKVIKNKFLRATLYVIGYISAVLIAMSFVALVIQYYEFPSDANSKWSSPYEESESVRQEVYTVVSAVRDKVNSEQEINKLEIGKNEIEIYDYSKADARKKSNDFESVSVEKLLEEDGVIESLFRFQDMQTFDDMEHYEPYFSKDSKFISIDWKDYTDLVNKTCVRFDADKYNYMFEDSGYEVTYDSKEEEELYSKLADSSAEYRQGITESSYFTFLGDKLYIFDPNSNSIYIQGYGYKYINEQYKLYFELTEDMEKTLGDEGAINAMLLESYPMDTAEELVYYTLTDNQRAAINRYYNNFYDSTGYSTSGNLAFSYDGKSVAHSWINDNDGLENIQKTSAGYNVDYNEIKKRFGEHCVVYLAYDSQKDTLDQWYKGTEGIKQFEYVSKEDIDNIFGDDKIDFVVTLYNGSDIIGFERDIYSYAREFSAPIVILVISIVLLLACIVFLTIGAEAKKIWFDYLPYLVFVIMLGILFSLVASVLMALSYSTSFGGYLANNLVNFIGIGILLILISYVVVAAVYMSVVRRVKCGKFLDGFITIKAARWIIKKIKNLFSRLPGKRRAIFVVISIFVINAIIMLALLYECSCVNRVGFLGVLVFIILAVEAATIYYLIKYMADVETLLKTGKEIEAGDLEAKVEVDELTFNTKELGETLNNLGAGLSTAVEASIRDERTKAELITNVSHDIKTPLTSIINYVDLLKKENIDNEKAREYIQVLEQKSERLKNLILDLIEVSKASTGNIELECMDLNLLELLSQAMGEYEEKFQELGLEIVETKNVDKAIIHADGRRVFRIIDNVLVNVSKYALPGTRVYLDVDTDENDHTVSLNVKNVSREMLNISAEELMERFVRGDRSRHTEGSGLGLSIAKNLTELQEGKFDIEIDGDLFKVIITFPMV